METVIAGPGAVALAFSTPILRKQFADSAATNAALEALVLERERTTPGIGRSNVGGWHSPEDVLEWPHPAIGTLRGYIAEGIGEISQYALGHAGQGLRVDLDGAAWVNLCRRGGYNRIHNHPDCDWSGVYYVSVGTPPPPDSPDAGKIEFLDPRMGATVLGPRGPDAPPKLVVDPEPGLMLIFPSWLYHFVNPYLGDAPRISLAFNVTLRITR